MNKLQNDNLKNRLKILIVEDDNVISMELKMTLKGMGYDVTNIASSGLIANKCAIENKPDIILMDIMLRGEMDGIEAARKIQEKVKIPIIYITAFGDDITHDKAMQTNPAGFLIKPFDDEELKSAIEDSLKKEI